MRRWTYAAVVVLACAAGCGDRTPVAEVGPTSPEPASMDAALAPWKDFPVTGTRPLVVVGPAVSAPATGFPDGETKEAWLAGAIDLPARLPAGPATAGGYPILTAAQAGRRLGEGGDESRAPARIAVTAARLGTVAVATDRGSRRLPAWFFTLRGIPGEASVLAVAPPALFTPWSLPDGTAAVGPATLHPDGTLTVEFVGAADEPGPCGTDYVVDLTETPTAVGFALRGFAHPPRDGEDVACHAIGYRREASVRPAAPLGNRVLVGEDGHPIQVVTG